MGLMTSDETDEEPHDSIEPDEDDVSNLSEEDLEITDLKLPKTVPKAPMPIMRSLVETYYDFQKQRIMAQGRIRTNVKTYNLDEDLLVSLGIMKILDDAARFEKNVKKILIKQLPNYCIYLKYFSHIHGIGPILASGLIAYIEDVKKFDTISKLWQYSGYGMNTYCPKCQEYTWGYKEFTNKLGKKKKAKVFVRQEICAVCGTKLDPRYDLRIQKKTAGYISNWNPSLKTHLWKCMTSFVKMKAEKSVFRRRYDEQRVEIRKKYPEKIVTNGKTKYNDGHVHNMAIHNIAQRLLSDIWVMWGECEGLPVKRSYAADIKGHSFEDVVLDK